MSRAEEFIARMRETTSSAGRQRAAARPFTSRPASPHASVDDENNAEYCAARARERGRVKAIFLSEPGKRNPVLAAHVALETSMPRDEAIAAMAALETAPAPTPSAAAQIIEAGKRRRGEASMRALESGSLARKILEAGAKARGESLKRKAS